ncbi:Uncharacterised protein [uncultured Clostridium sp.]|nr:Uncharacterised protein [uncultured Clostridium sp.]
MFGTGHHIDHPSARAQHPQEFLLRKGRKAVQQQVGPAGAHRLAEAGCHRILCRGQGLGRKTHRRLCDIKTRQLHPAAFFGKRLRDAAVVPALAAACIQQMQRRLRAGRLAVLCAQLTHRFAKDAVVSGIQERAAGGHHLLAVAGGLGAHALHRQQMPVALLGAVKAVAFCAFQGAVAGQFFPAQRALPWGKRFIFAHTSSLWSSMGAVAPPWAFIYSSKFVNFCCGGRRLMSTRPGSSSLAAAARPRRLLSALGARAGAGCALRDAF